MQDDRVILMALKRKRTRGRIKGWIQLAVHRKCQYTFLSAIRSISFTISSNIYTAQAQILQRTAYFKGCEVREGAYRTIDFEIRLLLAWAREKAKRAKLVNKVFIIHNEILRYIRETTFVERKTGRGWENIS